MGNALRNGASGAQLLAVSPVRGKGESSRLPHSRAEIAEKLFDFDILLACPPPNKRLANNELAARALGRRIAD